MNASKTSMTFARGTLPTPQHLEQLLHASPSNKALHLKKVGADTYKLYVAKGGGTGLKNFLFGTKALRETNTRRFMSDVFRAAGESGLFDDVVSSRPADHALTVADLAPAISGLAAKLHLPSGAVVENSGYFHGAQKITVVPNGTKGVFSAQHLAGQDMSAAFTSIGQDLLRQQKECGGVNIVVQADADFNRLCYRVPQGDGSTYRSDLFLGSDFDGMREPQMARALRDFTGSDTATTVLSSVLTQNTLVHLPKLMSTPAGAATMALKAASNSDFTQQNRTDVYRADGMRITLDSLPAMGASQWALSKNGNDFKVSIDWVTYLSPNPNEPGGYVMPLEDGSLIEAHIRLDIHVDAAAAAEGRLEISVPDGLNIRYTGQLKD